MRDLRQYLDLECIEILYTGGGIWMLIGKRGNLWFSCSADAVECFGGMFTTDYKSALNGWDYGIVSYVDDNDPLCQKAFTVLKEAM